MSNKRVLFIASERLAGGVIHSIFAGQGQYEAVEIHPADCRELARALREQQADVVVVDEQNLFCNQKNILGLFLNNDAQCNLPDFRLVVVSIVDNRVAVIERRAVRINQLADFFAVL